MNLDDLLRACALPEGDRRLQLFTTACARRVAAAMPDDDARRLVDLAEQRADGLLGEGRFLHAMGETLDPYIGNERARDGAGGATFGVLMHLHDTSPEGVRRLVRWVVEARAQQAYAGGYPTEIGLDEWLRRQVQEEDDDLARLFRCVCGGRGPEVVVCPGWLTPTVAALARGIDADRAFDRLPVLADALQDAGCEDDAVLAHCREPGPHAHGCWVVDGLLRAAREGEAK